MHFLGLLSWYFSAAVGHADIKTHLKSADGHFTKELDNLETSGNNKLQVTKVNWEDFDRL